jgi:hypothetical protein
MPLRLCYIGLEQAEVVVKGNLEETENDLCKDRDFNRNAFSGRDICIYVRRRTYGH